MKIQEKIGLFILIILYLMPSVLLLKIISLVGISNDQLKSADILNTIVSSMLILVTMMYVILTGRMANSMNEQTESNSRQTRIQNLEKKLEKVYNPIYEILKPIDDDEANPFADKKHTHQIYCQINDIFKTYSYLVTEQKIIDEWNHTQTIKETLPRFVKQSKETIPATVTPTFFKLIKEERNKLITEHRMLVSGETIKK